MISVLLVEDDSHKLANIRAIFSEIAGGNNLSVSVANTVQTAIEALRKQRFDLMVLDLNLPMRQGDLPSPEGGIRILDNISRKGSAATVPVHIIGLTAVEELRQKHELYFRERLWHLILYASSSSDWAQQLGQKLIHIIETKYPAPKGEYLFDLAILTALHHVELEAVLALQNDWEAQERDGTTYHVTQFNAGAGSLSVVATAAAEMGMPAATAAAMNLIHLFRPRYIAMTGIAAGTKGHFGDILVATHAWDYGSGKILETAGTSQFHPAPSQIQLDPRVRSKLQTFCLDQSILRAIQAEWTGEPPPIAPLAHHLGAIASGASVVESTTLIQELRQRDRKVVGVEMEAYGVFMAARVCTEPRPMAMVFKSVCDFGDSKKNDDYQRYAAYTSARFCREFALRHLTVPLKRDG